METMMWVVLVVALTLAIGMAVVAWRLLRGDRARTEARASMLRQLAFEPEPALDERAFQDVDSAAIAPEFGATVDRDSPGSRRLMAAAVVLVFMAVGAASVYGIYGPSGNRDVETGGTPANVSKASRRGEVAPLELLSLSHRADGGDFIVAGLVQNPAGGRLASGVMAVVYVFNAAGDYFASGKAALEFGPLAPGVESPFIVRLPKTSGVSRFRVGFRAQDGSVVAHVDRRGQPVAGTTAGGL